MAVTTKKQFPNAVGVSGQSATVFTPVGIQLNNQDDLDVYVTLSGGTRVLQLRQTSGSTATSSHPQVNNTDGLYFPAVSVGTTLYNYTLSTDNNTITFSTALPSGATVFCERRTRDADSSYTTFASGSTIRATDLNNSSTESNFTAQDGRNKVFEIEGVLFRGDQPSTNYVTTDHIVNDSVTADKIPDDTINSEHYVASSIDLEHMSANSVDSDQYVDGSIDEVHISNSAVTQNKLADNSVGTPEIINGSVTDDKIATGTLDNRYFTETELDPNASAGANVLDARYYTETEADARFYNVASTEEIQSGETWVAADNKVATTAAIDARIIDLVDDVGGFHPIPNETSFPSVNVDVNNGAGTLISIKEIVTARTPSSGIVTIANGAGSSTVTITGCGSTVLAAGFGAIVETTSTLHTYAFHRLQPKATEVTTVAGSIANVNTTAGSIANVNIVGPDIANVNTVAGSIGSVNTVAGSISSVNNASTNINSINNFGDLYQVNSSNPSTDGGGASLSAGDLYFNTSADRLKVYTGTDWVDGVIASGGGAQTSGDTFTGDLKLNDNVKLLIGTGSDLEIFHTSSDSKIQETGTGSLYIQSDNQIILGKTGGENLAKFIADGKTELYFDNAKKFETTATGISVTGAITSTEKVTSTEAITSTERVLIGTTTEVEVNADDLTIATTGNTGITIRSGNTSNGVIQFSDATSGTGEYAGYIDYDHDIDLLKFGTASSNRFQINSSGNVQIPNDSGRLQLGASQDLELYHSSNNSIINNSASGYLFVQSDNLALRSTGQENMITGTANGAVELYHDNVKKFETTSYGALLSGAFAATGNIDCSSDTAKIRAGASQDLELYHTGTNNHIDSVNGALVIRSDVFQLSTLDGTHKYINIPTDEQGVEFYYDNVKKFETASTGVTVSGNIFLEDDNGGDTLRRLVVGSGNDLIIYHDGSNSYIKEQGTGSLILESNHLITKAAAYSFQNANNTESLIYAVENGKVELFFDGSSKFETTTTGIDITGKIKATSNIEINTDNSEFRCGASDDFKISHSSTENINILRSDSPTVFRNNANDETLAKLTPNGSVELYYDNSKKFETTTDGTSISGHLKLGENANITGTPHTYKYTRGSSKSGVSVYESEAAMEIVASDGGAHSASLLIRSNVDGAGFNYDPTNNALELKTFTTTADDFTIHATGANVSNLDTQLKIVKDGAVELSHNGTKKLETTSTGATVTGTLQADSYGDIKLADPFIEMAQTITTSRTISNNYNAFTVGPVAINTGVTVTVGDGENWVIV